MFIWDTLIQWQQPTSHVCAVSFLFCQRSLCGGKLVCLCSKPTSILIEIFCVHVYRNVKNPGQTTKWWHATNSISALPTGLTAVQQTTHITHALEEKASIFDTTDFNTADAAFVEISGAVSGGMFFVYRCTCTAGAFFKGACARVFSCMCPIAGITFQLHLV